ncbi:hypothetical protein B0T18DRAFT_228858 [Schizothecium vesticola]|uniref:Secreted protein n=1 Tax=Schizothecium vesticola TaxID=314040 RepID=A0AA40K0P3_9PEZI|nr:hypothetical protein B0T18DRAFT_228858 [Schizothecium vesticola]
MGCGWCWAVILISRQTVCVERVWRLGVGLLRVTKACVMKSMSGRTVFWMELVDKSANSHELCEDRTMFPHIVQTRMDCEFDVIV